MTMKQKIAKFKRAAAGLNRFKSVESLTNHLHKSVGLRCEPGRRADTCPVARELQKRSGLRKIFVSKGSMLYAPSPSIPCSSVVQDFIDDFDSGRIF